MLKMFSSIVNKRQAMKRKGEDEAVTLHHLDQRSVLDALDGAQLCEAVEGGASQLEGETGAVAGDLVLHQHLVQLCHQQLARHLRAERSLDSEQHEDAVKKITTDAHQNLELKTFCSRRLNSDSEAGLLEVNDVADAQVVAFIPIRRLWRFVLRAFFSLTWWHC